jgi:hypothetical protein
MIMIVSCRARRPGGSDSYHHDQLEVVTRIMTVELSDSVELALRVTEPGRTGPGPGAQESGLPPLSASTVSPGPGLRVDSAAGLLAAAGWRPRPEQAHALSVWAGSGRRLTDSESESESARWTATGATRRRTACQPAPGG